MGGGDVMAERPNSIEGVLTLGTLERRLSLLVSHHLLLLLPACRRYLLLFREGESTVVDLTTTASHEHYNHCVKEKQYCSS